MCFYGQTADKQTEKQKSSKKKMAQDTPRTNTDVVYEFQLNRFGSFGGYSGHTKTHTRTNTQDFIRGRDCFTR